MMTGKAVNNKEAKENLILLGTADFRLTDTGNERMK